MKNRIKRIGLGLLAALFVAVFVMVPAQLSAPQAAQALCYPPSTVNPACQPQNLPILIEAGIVNIGGGGAGSVAAGAATTGAASALPTLAASGTFGIAGTAALVSYILDQAEAKGFTRMDGLKDQVLKTDPNYVSTEPTSCTLLSPTGTAYVGSNKTTNLMTAEHRKNTCIPGTPWFAIFSDEYNRAGGRTLLVTAAAGVVTLAVGAFTTLACGTLCDFGVRRVCDSDTTNARTDVDILSASTVSWSAFTQTISCPAGSTLVGVYFWAQVPGASSFSNAMLYNPSNSHPREGGTIEGMIRTTIKCRPTAGGPDITITVPAQSVSVTPGQNIPIPDALCPAGYFAVQTMVDFKKPSDPGFTPIIDTPAPDSITELPSLYPNCFGAAAVPCELLLYKIVGTELQSCGINGELCDGWAQSLGARENYECYYGEYPVELDKCSAYRYPQLGKLPNVKPDGSPVRIEDPAPSSGSSTSNPIRDPLTGLPIPVPVTPVAPQPGTTNCFPTGWGVLNPIAWVLQPVQCALQWAFVPKQSSVNTAWSRIGTSWARWGVVKVVTAATAWEFLPPGGGCSGITVDMGWLLPQAPQAHFFNACPGEPLAPYAAWSKVLLTLSIVVAGVLSVTSSVSGLVSYRGLGE